MDAPRYDLLLKGGRLVDPAASIDGQRDIAFHNGRVAAVEKNLPREAARNVVDVSDSYVAPGLVDMHVHAFIHAYDVGLQLDDICAPSGVTTVCDGGSVGAVNFRGMNEYVVARAETRVFAYLNISAIGMTTVRKRVSATNFANVEEYVGISEYKLLDYADPTLAAEIVSANRDVILGIKVRIATELTGTGDEGLEPLRRALTAAQTVGTPIMIHLERPPVEYTQVLDLLRPGDIVSHVYYGGPGILDERGRVKGGVLEARKRGVLFEVAYGQFHFNANVARAALEQGFYPDAISTDMSRRGHLQTVKDLPTTLSKLLALGMPFNDVVRAATADPARILGHGSELGTLRVGAAGDASVFRIEEGKVVYNDTDGNTFEGSQRWVPQLTLRRGRVWWQGHGQTSPR